MKDNLLKNQRPLTIIMSLGKFKRKLLVLVVFSLVLVVFVQAYPSVYPKGVTIDKPSKTYDGYTVFKRTYFDQEGKPTGKEDILMVDMEGNTVHKWEDVGFTLHYDILKNGHIFLGEFLHQCPGGGCKINGTRPPISGNLRAIVERDWNNNIVWRYESDHLHHDVDALPNGDIMATFYTTLPEELNDQIKGGIPGTEVKGGRIYADYIRLIDHETKKTLWEWKSWEQLNISDYPLNSNINRRHWPYINHAKYLPEGNPFNGNESVLISMRNSNSLIIVDMETKEVVWEWGKDKLSLQHEPVLLNNGNILVFDNGWLQNDDSLLRKFSKVLEINPKTNHIVWEYSGSRSRFRGLANGFRFNTPVGGFLRRLPNGNTLITECLTGRIFEVTPEKEIVWEYVTGVPGVTSVRRFRQEEVDFPEELPPARPTGEPLGGRNIVNGREIIKEPSPVYKAIVISGWIVAILCIVLLIKIKGKKVE